MLHHIQLIRMETVVKLQTANLITRGVRMDDGVTQPIRAIVRLNGRDVSVILKEIEPPFIAAECFAALLLRGWGLNVPEPVLVDIEGAYAFGSLEVNYPSLKQRINFASLNDIVQKAVFAHISVIVSNWKNTPLAIAIDEAIGNKDRNIGNILWDGGEPWFIDHERSFELIRQPDFNKLAQIVSTTDLSDSIQKSAVSAVFLLLPSVLDEAEQAISEFQTKAYNDYVKNRIPLLANKILQRFPQPQDLFNQTTQ